MNNLRAEMRLETILGGNSRNYCAASALDHLPLPIQGPAISSKHANALVLIVVKLEGLDKESRGADSRISISNPDAIF